MPIEQLIGEIDSYIRSLMPDGGQLEGFYGMLKYHLGWTNERLAPTKADPGKRVRARLSLLCCMAAGAPPERAIAPAAAVELIHNFSLVHDDIQDRSRLRRHRRAVWAIWGEAQAINVGDALLALAYSALTRDPQGDLAVVARASQELTAACRLLCEGQFLDLHYEQRQAVTLGEYRAMIERKTGALLGAACYLGALYGSAQDSSLGCYAAFGKQLGIAFQMRDDCLGIWGESSRTGKPTAADLVAKKKTLPITYAMSATTGTDCATLDAILGRRGKADRGEVEKLLDILDRCGAAAYSESQIANANAAALKALAEARPTTDARAAIEQLAAELTVRHT